jgi:hypothetical protein
MFHDEADAIVAVTKLTALERASAEVERALR